MESIKHFVAVGDMSVNFGDVRPAVWGIGDTPEKAYLNAAQRGWMTSISRNSGGTLEIHEINAQQVAAVKAVEGPIDWADLLAVAAGGPPPLPTPSPWNPRYEVYAASNGKTPEEMLTHDAERWPGGRMAGFVIWISGRWQQWEVERGGPVLKRKPDDWKSEADHKDFDAWLRRPTPVL